MSDSLLIIGAGGQGRSIYEIASLSGDFSNISYLDDNWNNENSERSNIIGRIAQLSEYGEFFTHAIIGIGNNKLRAQLQYEAKDAGFILATLIHPKAIVSPTANIGDGTVISAGAVVGVDVHIGQGVIVNCAATIDHDGTLEDFSHLGVGVHLAGNCHIGKSAFLQSGSCGGYLSYADDYSVIAPGSVLKSRA